MQKHSSTSPYLIQFKFFCKLHDNNPFWVHIPATTIQFLYDLGPVRTQALAGSSRKFIYDVNLSQYIILWIYQDLWVGQVILQKHNPALVTACNTRSI